MRLILTDDDGNVLDTLNDITREDWDADQRAHPYSLLSLLSPGDEGLDTD